MLIADSCTRQWASLSLSQNPKTAAANVVTRLLGKPKVPVLDRIMAFARDKLMEYAHAAPNARDPRLKDGVLAMISALRATDASVSPCVCAADTRGLARVVASPLPPQLAAAST